jgi:Sec-independent protein translocase protein TatA
LVDLLEEKGVIELLTITVILIVVVVLFAVATGRRSGGNAKETLEAVRNADEVKDEVEALPSDTLRARARTWVRKPKG